MTTVEFDRSHSLLRSRRSAMADDRGVTMVMVLGIMMVGALLTSMLAIAVVFNSNFTLKNRMDMQARASADAGIDTIMDLFNGATYEDLATMCTRDFVINNDAVEVRSEWIVDRSGTEVETTCPEVTDIVKSVVVTSTATTSGLIGQDGPVVKTVVAEFDASVAPTPGFGLDKAIFSEASVTITNNTVLNPSGAVDSSGDPVMDADIYSNGSVRCLTQVESSGSIYAAYGDVDLENTCEVYESVWAAGHVYISSQAKVFGDVYAASNASTYGIRLSNNSSYIDGNALTNGGIYIEQGKPTVGGINGFAFARTGPITFKNGGQIAGSAYTGANLNLEGGAIIDNDAIVKGNIVTGSGQSSDILGDVIVSGTVGSKVDIGGSTTTVANPAFPNNPDGLSFPSDVGYPGEIQSPRREQFPYISMNADDINEWVGAGWAVTTLTSAADCVDPKPGQIAQALSWAAGPHLLNFTGCTGPVTFNNHSLTYGSDVAFVSKTGFRSQNLHFMQSNNVAEPRTIFWIVPADSPGITWVDTYQDQTTPSCSSSAPYTQLDKAKLESIYWLIYTPCTFRWTNGTDTSSEPFTGQLYGGSVLLPNATDMKMHPISVPSLTDTTSGPNPDDPVLMNLLARYDIRG